MNLNEAIDQALSTAENVLILPKHILSQVDSGAEKRCAEQHLQLAIYLTELKMRRWQNLVRCWQTGFFPFSAQYFQTANPIKE